MARRLIALTLISCACLTGVASFRSPAREHITRARPITIASPSAGAHSACERIEASHHLQMAARSRCRPHSTTSLPSQPADAEETELTPAAIAEMIEVSFLQSCLQLSQGYIDVLKLFIVAVKAGYQRGMPLIELQKLVEECPVNSAGRDLMTEEKDLRLEWMGMVYAMLNALGPESKVDSSEGTRSESANERISNVVEAMLAIRDRLQSEEETTGGKEDATVALTTLTVKRH